MKDMPEFDEFEDEEERFTGFHLGEVSLEEMDQENISCADVEVTENTACARQEETTEENEEHNNLFVLTPEDEETLNRIRRGSVTIYRRKVRNKYYRKPTDKLYVEVGKVYLIWHCKGE